jgi:Protein of unknown function (DUF3800)
MERTPLPELKITNDRLLVFIDDTGHEAFKGAHNYYGLGGCVVLGAHYEWMKTQWREVRRQINGNPDAPLHAADMARTQANFNALSKFFLDPSFARLAAVSTKEAHHPIDMHSAIPVMGTLAGHIDDLARLIPCNGVTIIVESSQRADPIFKQYFGQLQSAAADPDRPAEHWLMPKSSGEPGLEVADFIISAAGSQAKRIARGQDGLAPDFEDVFGRLPAVGCLFSFITEVEGSQAEGVVRMQGLRVAN